MKRAEEILDEKFENLNKIEPNKMQRPIIVTAMQAYAQQFINLDMHDVSGSACRELVECADCENRHFKDERVEKKKGAWTTYRCPKCGSESYCRI